MSHERPSTLKSGKRYFGTPLTFAREQKTPLDPNCLEIGDVKLPNPVLIKSAKDAHASLDDWAAIDRSKKDFDTTLKDHLEKRLQSWSVGPMDGYSPTFNTEDPFSVSAVRDKVSHLIERGSNSSETEIKTWVKSIEIAIDELEVAHIRANGVAALHQMFEAFSIDSPGKILASEMLAVSDRLNNSGLGTKEGKEGIQLFRNQRFQDKDTRFFDRATYAHAILNVIRNSCDASGRVNYAKLLIVDRAIGLVQINGKDNVLRELRRKLVDSAFRCIGEDLKPTVDKVKDSRKKGEKPKVVKAKDKGIVGKAIGFVRGKEDGRKRRQKQPDDKVRKVEPTSVITPGGEEIYLDSSGDGNSGGDDGGNSGDGGVDDHPIFPDEINDDCSGSNFGCIGGVGNFFWRHKLIVSGLATAAILGGVCISGDGGSDNSGKNDDDRISATRQITVTPVYSLADYFATESAKSATKTVIPTLVQTITPRASETVTVVTATKTKAANTSTPVPASTIEAIIANATAKVNATATAIEEKTQQSDKTPARRPTDLPGVQAATSTAEAVKTLSARTRTPIPTTTPDNMSPVATKTAVTITPTPDATSTQVLSALGTSTKEPTSTSTVTRSSTPTSTNTAVATATTTFEASKTAIPTPSETPTSTPTSSPTPAVPSASPTQSPVAPVGNHPTTSGELSQGVAKFLIAASGNAQIEYKGDNFTEATGRNFAPLGITNQGDIDSYVQFEQKELGKDLNLVYVGDEVVKTDDLINKEAYIWRTTSRPLPQNLIDGLAQESVPTDSTIGLSLDGSSIIPDSTISAPSMANGGYISEKGDDAVVKPSSVWNSKIESLVALWSEDVAQVTDNSSDISNKGALLKPIPVKESGQSAADLDHSYYAWTHTTSMYFGPTNQNSYYPFRKLYGFLFDEEEKKIEDGTNRPSLAYQR